MTDSFSNIQPTPEFTAEHTRAMATDMVNRGQLSPDRANSALQRSGIAPIDFGNAETAQVALDSFRRGEHSLSKAFVIKTPEYAAAQEHHRQLVEALAPAGSDETALPPSNTETAVDRLPLAYDPTKHDQATMDEGHKLANESIVAMGLDREFAVTGIREIERAHASRIGMDGIPRAMDRAELATMENNLTALWGDEYDAKITLFEDALRKAGPGAAWLQQAILAAGPKTAAWAIAGLVKSNATT